MLDAGFQMAGWLLLKCGTPMTQAGTRKYQYVSLSCIEEVCNHALDIGSNNPTIAQNFCTDPIESSWRLEFPAARRRKKPWRSANAPLLCRTWALNGDELHWHSSSGDAVNCAGALVSILIQSGA
jgi:hypothetical protein